MPAFAILHYFNSDTLVLCYLIITPTIDPWGGGGKPACLTGTIHNIMSSQVTEIDALIGQNSNAAVIRRAFDRIIKLLDGLSKDLEKPLPKDATPAQVTGEVRW